MKDLTKPRLKETMMTPTTKTETARIPIQCMNTSTGSKSEEKIKDPDLVVEDLAPEETGDPEKEEHDLEIVTGDQKKGT